jgi:predicted DNA binding CopG/RHH family protein
MAQAALDQAGGEAARIALRLTHSQRKAVLELAAERGVAYSQLVRELIDRELRLAGPAPPERGG